LGSPVCDFSAATAGTKTALASVRAGDIVTDALGYFPTACTVVSYNPSTFQLTLSANATDTPGPGPLDLTTKPPAIAGYNAYRSTVQGGPFTKVNLVPTDRIAYFHDEALQPLTKFYYRVTAVDSSGNESGFFTTLSVSTNPPHHAIFPVPTNGTTPSSVAVEFAYSTNFATVAAGSARPYGLDAAAPT